MSRVAVFSASVTLALVVFGELVHADDRPPQTTVNCQRPRLSRAQVISLANAEARRSKLRLSNFEAPAVECKIEAGEAVWEVFYSGKSHIVDDCFSVDVNDRTRTVKVFICA